MSISMRELSLKALNIRFKRWTNQGHVNHSAQWNIKPRCFFWIDAHVLNAFVRIDLQNLSKLDFI
jgi:hypothetical protein